MMSQDINNTPINSISLINIIPIQNNLQSLSKNPNNNNLTICSINANNSLKKNISLYVDLIRKKNIDILCIQEPGPFTSEENTTNIKEDSTVIFDLKSNNLTSFTTFNRNNRYSLVTICSCSIAQLIKKERELSNIQCLSLITEKGPITIINTYINHDKISANETINMIKMLKKNNPHIIICGDLNSYPNSTTDYYSTSKSKNKDRKNKHKLFKNISEHLIDSFRHCNPNKISFTKWTFNSNTNPPSVTATRLDHILISKSIAKNIIKSKIIETNYVNSDHLPIYITLMLKKPKDPKNNQVTNQNPHHSKWPKSLFNDIETRLEKINKEIKIISSTKDIDIITEQITNAISYSWSSYINSLPKMKSKTKNFNEIKKIKTVRNTLLKTTNNWYHIIKKYNKISSQKMNIKEHMR